MTLLYTHNSNSRRLAMAHAVLKEVEERLQRAKSPAAKREATRLRIRAERCMQASRESIREALLRRKRK